MREKRERERERKSYKKERKRERERENTFCAGETEKQDPCVNELTAAASIMTDKQNSQTTIYERERERAKERGKRRWEEAEQESGRRITNVRT